MVFLLYLDTLPSLAVLLAGMMSFDSLLEYLHLESKCRILKDGEYLK